MEIGLVGLDLDPTEGGRGIKDAKLLLVASNDESGRTAVIVVDCGKRSAPFHSTRLIVVSHRALDQHANDNSPPEQGSY